MIGHGTFPNKPIANCIMPMAIALSETKRSRLCQNSTLRTSKRSIFTFGICATHNQQHAAHFGCRVHKYEEREERNEQKKTLTISITETTDCSRFSQEIWTWKHQSGISPFSRNYYDKLIMLRSKNDVCPLVPYF